MTRPKFPAPRKSNGAPFVLYTCYMLYGIFTITFQESLNKTVQKVHDLEKLYGSQLVWKIDRYAERMQEAKTGKKITIFSPPFMTSRHGYKLAVSLCLNGDGKGKALYQWA